MFLCWRWGMGVTNVYSEMNDEGRRVVRCVVCDVRALCVCGARAQRSLRLFLLPLAGAEEKRQERGKRVTNLTSARLQCSVAAAHNHNVILKLFKTHILLVRRTSYTHIVVIQKKKYQKCVIMSNVLYRPYLGKRQRWLCCDL